MRLISILAAAAFAVGCAPASAPPAQSAAVAEALDGCAAGEENVFSCRIGATVAAVCAAAADGAVALHYRRGDTVLPATGADGGVEAGRYASANGGVVQFLRFGGAEETPVAVISETRCGPQCWERFEGVIVERADGSRETLACEGAASLAAEGDTQFADAARRAGIAVDEGRNGMERFPEIDSARP